MSDAPERIWLAKFDMDKGWFSTMPQGDEFVAYVRADTRAVPADSAERAERVQHCAKCGRELAWVEFGPPINDGHYYHLHHKTVFCDEIEPSVETVLDAHDKGRIATPVPVAPVAPSVRAVQPAASFQPPNTCPECAKGVPFDEHGKHVR